MITTTNGTSRELTSLDKERSKAHYIFHADRLKKNISDMNKAFKSRYGNFRIGYSFKTNYLKEIIDIVSDAGCMAEVVSPAEFDYARCCNVPEENVIYNGVIPDHGNKFMVANRGGMVNVDNYAEYKALSKLAADANVHIYIGLRVNIDVDAGYISRFGVDVNGEEFTRIMDEIASDSHVTISGFHCHIGTTRQAKFWKKKAEILVDLAKKYNASYIDLGGGMYGPMIEELASQFNGYAKTYDEYAEVICPLFKEAFPDESVKLIVEPGTALVGNTIDLVCHITNIKKVNGKQFVTVDTCSNHLGMICECRVIPVAVYHDAKNGECVELHDADICGCTCLEFDYIRKNFDGAAAVGDIIVFPNIGAYSISATRQFIVGRPAVVDSSAHKVFRRGDTMIDMFGKYLFA